MLVEHVSCCCWRQLWSDRHLQTCQRNESLGLRVRSCRHVRASQETTIDDVTWVARLPVLAVTSCIGSKERLRSANSFTSNRGSVEACLGDDITVGVVADTKTTTTTT